MAVTYRGSFKTSAIFGNDATSQNLVAIINPVNSRYDIKIRRLVLQNDNLVASSQIMPLCRTSRCAISSISGGVDLEISPFDASNTSASGIVIKAQVNETARVTATPGTTIWQQFISRLLTAVEQQQGADSNMLSYLIADTGKDFVLHPGEALLIHLTVTNVSANSINMNSVFIQGIFEEEPVSTYAISGTVTLSAAPVSGAIVTIVEADDESMTNQRIIEKIVTGAGGTWASSIRTGYVGAAFVQYKFGGTYYTAPGSPYLSP